jgi:hypothetical protein
MRRADSWTELARSERFELPIQRFAILGFFTLISSAGLEDRDRHAVERPTSCGVGSRSGLRATVWPEAWV